MRIDLNPASMPELERSRGTSGASTKADADNQVSGQSEDVAKLATGSDAIETLKTKLDAVADIRQEKVESLREAIGNDTYSISPDSIAASMLAEIGGTRG